RYRCTYALEHWQNAGPSNRRDRGKGLREATLIDPRRGRCDNSSAEENDQRVDAKQCTGGSDQADYSEESALNCTGSEPPQRLQYDGNDDGLDPIHDSLNLRQRS